jgi:hypothetical protein
MRKISIAFVLFAVLASPAYAQSSWGVQGSYVPRWETLPRLEGLFGDEVNLEGSDITVGITRGSMNGGDWGVSFVRKNIDDSSVVRDMGTRCFGTMSQFCFPDGAVWELGSAFFTGVEAHRFVPFVRINRVQIGMTFAGGVASMSGNVTKTSYNPRVVSQMQGRIVIDRGESTTQMTAKDALADIGGPSVFPLGRVEATVAVRATSHLKVKAGGGFNFPGTAKFTVGATWLF